MVALGAFAEVSISPDTALVDAMLVTLLGEALADAERLRSVSELDVSRPADVVLMMVVEKSVKVLVESDEELGLSGERDVVKAMSMVLSLPVLSSVVREVCVSPKGVFPDGVLVAT